MADEYFPQFDEATDFWDHHMASKNNSKISPTLQKKIAQELNLVAKNMPRGIYVRVCETRIDLIRAAIVGPRGTPYHDGLFFFDIAFPCDYPAKPPLLYYHSFGYDISSCLFPSGRVRLSLLGTWFGFKSERWNPSYSTLLQILLSIQALVLKEKPYPDPPKSSYWIGTASIGDDFSLCDNVRVFLQNCKTMLRVLQNPPKNFEPLVHQHFKDRAEFILTACDAYRKGLVRVGCFSGVLEGKSEQLPVKFKEPMDHMFEDLVMGLSKTGASIGKFIKMVEKEREMKSEAEAKAKEDAIAAANNEEGISVKLLKVLQKTCRCLLVDDEEQECEQQHQSTQEVESCEVSKL